MAQAQVSLTLTRSMRDVAAELAKLGCFNQRGAAFSPSSRAVVHQDDRALERVSGFSAASCQ